MHTFEVHLLDQHTLYASAKFSAFFTLGIGTERVAAVDEIAVVEVPTTPCVLGPIDKDLRCSGLDVDDCVRWLHEHRHNIGQRDGQSAVLS